MMQTEQKDSTEYTNKKRVLLTGVRPGCYCYYDYILIILGITKYFIEKYFFDAFP